MIAASTSGELFVLVQPTVKTIATANSQLRSQLKSRTPAPRGGRAAKPCRVPEPGSRASGRCRRRSWRSPYRSAALQDGACFAGAGAFCWRCLKLVQLIAASRLPVPGEVSPTCQFRAGSAVQSISCFGVCQQQLHPGLGCRPL